ncbi:DUF354 domain-containing protein [Desulfonema ishimotonii]|uniref:DUF354 domain-containing protein n=1 Tax=Desulfonema ishimotonii TaxID=45657 RepID=A0A401FTV0_9BACT|nr:DUF354 domain-containing protein [Desulfonema ishimotonii]GBC60383.1 DUF354 domain-containing protein [Desulfonema ishimotonii]
MRILVDIGHPAHVHFYKHAIWDCQRRGHEVLISARNKDVTIPLLNRYGFPYKILSDVGSGFWGLTGEFIKREWALIHLIRGFDPHVVTEIGGLFIAPVCKLLGKPSVVFTDTEIAPLDPYLVYPFADIVCTPDCFMRNIGKNHMPYAGYHELAYLNPDYFRPDPTVLDELGVEEGEPFIVLRFVAWKASHDIGQHGFTFQSKQEAVTSLSRYGKVFITSEMPLPDEFEPYRITVPPHRIHDVLYYARLFIGDGATMATEAALLGTPAIYTASMASNLGNFVDLMGRYRLVYSYTDPHESLKKAISLLKDKKSKEDWRRRLKVLLADKIDVTQYIVRLLEKYPYAKS